MASFDSAIPVILKHEGGYVNNPADPGGPTNWGISTLIIKREGITAKQLGIPDLTADSIKVMKVDAAKWVYKTLFWDKYNYGSIIDQNIATKTMDVSVNCGPSRAHKFAQEAANSCGAKLTVDGILGPKSIEAINKCDSKAWMKAMCAIQLKYYQDLVVSKPSLIVFINNWTKRSNWGL